MGIVDPESLAVTLDAVNEAFFFDRPLSQEDREGAARWIAGRQGLPGSYAGMFAPTERDRQEGMRVYSGEQVGKGGGAKHIMSEEACRGLILLDVADGRLALARASRAMMKRLEKSREPGMYCCGRCSVSLWRHLAVGGLEDPERRLAAGMTALRSHRREDGRWRRFPFYYTLLALCEIELHSAIEEMRHAAPACERSLARLADGDAFSRRRRVLVERVLAKC